MRYATLPGKMLCALCVYIANKIRIAWLRHNVGIINGCIRDELAFRDSHEVRIRKWYHLRAMELAELNRLQSTVDVDWGLAGNKWNSTP